MIILKYFWRKKMMHHRNALHDDEVHKCSQQIQDTLLETVEWKNAEHINVYRHTGNEVATDKLIHNCVTRRDKYLHIPTDKPTDNRRDVDIVVAPGVVFDERRARYGRGGGYYDRFLEKIPKKTVVIAIAYDFQVLRPPWKLKLNELDVKMDMIITEKRIIQKAGTLNY